eukprot:m.220496 g.220496  ORF g.220496 m.220496 type:complete len:254 (-) comp15601_c0_seq11:28-789(-)
MDNYRIEGKIGEGAHGVVLKAKEIRSGATVALKKVMIRRLEDGIPKNALREIKALQEIDVHENIVTMRSVFSQGNGFVLVFDYMFSDLSQVITNYDLTAAQIKSYMVMLLRGVSFCHDNHIMHRDLKPANILVDENGEVKIGDLGLVKMAHILNRFGKHTLVGTPSYRAPEVGDDCRDYGSAVDIYALGIISWEIQFKRDPAADHPSRLQQIARAGGAMGELIWLPQRCAATDPELRPSSHGLYLALANVSQG